MLVTKRFSIILVDFPVPALGDWGRVLNIMVCNMCSASLQVSNKVLLDSLVNCPYHELAKHVSISFSSRSFLFPFALFIVLFSFQSNQIQIIYKYSSIQ